MGQHAMEASARTHECARCHCRSLCVDGACDVSACLYVCQATACIRMSHLCSQPIDTYSRHARGCYGNVASHRSLCVIDSPACGERVCGDPQLLLLLRLSHRQDATIDWEE